LLSFLFTARTGGPPHFFFLSEEGRVQSLFPFSSLASVLTPLPLPPPYGSREQNRFPSFFLIEDRSLFSFFFPKILNRLTSFPFPFPSAKWGKFTLFINRERDFLPSSALRRTFFFLFVEDAPGTSPLFPFLEIAIGLPPSSRRQTSGVSDSFSPVVGVERFPLRAQKGRRNLTLPFLRRCNSLQCPSKL